MCKSININSGSKEIKDKEDHEWYWTIYDAMCTIGAKVNQEAPNGKSAIAMAFKKAAQENIPVGEELNSITTE